VVRKFALEREKLMHSLCPTDIANKFVEFLKNGLWMIFGALER